jgi:prepilin-type N-terminal cleavage/methylation domain-containing protein
MRRRRRGTRGMSLLETLCAMSLFAIAASGVGKLATGSMRYSIANRHGTAAAFLAEQQLESLRGGAYAGILPTSSSATVNGQSYTIATGVLENVPAPNMKQITVTVSWQGPEGTGSYAVQTIYTSITS